MAKNITLRFLGDASQLNRVFNQVESQGARMGGGLKKGLGLAGIGAASAGIAIAGFAKTSITAFKDSEAAQGRLSDAYKRFPALASANIGALREYNTELSKKTRYDDDATASGQAVLAQYGVTGAQLKQLTPLVQDYAAKTGKDMNTAAKDVGKALQGKGRALMSVGLNLKDAGSQGANFENVVKGLRGQVGGFAEREGKTAAGQSEILKNQFGELQEKVGAKLVPALTSLGDILLKVIDWFDRLSPGVKTALGVLTGVLGVVLVLTKAIQAWTAVQAMLNTVLLANPIGLVVIALAALAAALYLAWTKSETFRTIVITALQAVLNFFLGFVELFVGGAAKAFGWVPGLGPKLQAAAAAVATFRNDVNAYLNGIKDKNVSLTVTWQEKGFIGPIAKQFLSQSGRVSQPGEKGFIGPVARRAEGGVFSSYAAGGMRENHTAQIARAGDWRVWAEPETGGEAYIPLAGSKRGRSVAIWEETGRRLGQFANGGIVGRGRSTSEGAGNNMTMNVTVNASGYAEGQAAGKAFVDEITRYFRGGGAVPAWANPS